MNSNYESVCKAKFACAMTRGGRGFAQCYVGGNVANQNYFTLLGGGECKQIAIDCGIFSGYRGLVEES